MAIGIKPHTQNHGIVRYLWITLGCLSLALGTIGIVLPILPTVPFYMLTMFCFTKSSKRLHNWFIHTNLYKKHLQNFVEKKSMPLRSKITIMCSVTLMMGIAFFFMPADSIGKTALFLAWLFHVLYFIFGIKTTR